MIVVWYSVVHLIFTCYCVFKIQNNFQIFLTLSFSEALISAIQEDIEEAKRQLDLPEHLKLKEDNFFHLPEGKIVNNH